MQRFTWAISAPSDGYPYCCIKQREQGQRQELTVMITNLPARSKGLVVLMSLNPEVSAEVCKYLGQTAMNDLISQLHRLPSESYDYSVRQQVLTEFAQHSGIAIEAGTVDMLAFESTAKNSPEQFANFLKTYSKMEW